MVVIKVANIVETDHDAMQNVTFYNVVKFKRKSHSFKRHACINVIKNYYIHRVACVHLNYIQPS